MRTAAASTTAEAAGADQQITCGYYRNGYLREVIDSGNERYARFQYDQDGNRISEYSAELPFASGLQSQGLPGGER